MLHYRSKGEAKLRTLSETRYTEFPPEEEGNR
jgi:hypothetical protein